MHELVDELRNEKVRLSLSPKAFQRATFFTDANMMTTTMSYVAHVSANRLNFHEVVDELRT